ncbi:MAG: hypothetical protein QG635_615 [Bacteroidota bacterium]|nr:hypothetical protein [Bacteroidota bacterium]
MIIADENIHSEIINSLRDAGHDVLSIIEQYSGISDENIINLSIENKRIILTEDKDFGEWVFAHNIRNISVIFLRYNHKDLQGIKTALLSVLSNNIDALFGNFITITINKIRIRSLLKS